MTGVQTCALPIYDMCTPIMTAWDLHRAWPEAEFILVDDAGHAASEPGIARALRAATDRFAAAAPGPDVSEQDASASAPAPVPAVPESAESNPAESESAATADASPLRGRLPGPAPAARLSAAGGRLPVRRVRNSSDRVPVELGGRGIL